MYGEPADLDVSYEQMRGLVLAALRGVDGGEVGHLRRTVAVEADRIGAGRKGGDQPASQFGRQPVNVFGTHEPTLSDRDFEQVRNIVGDLIIEGIVRPGLNNNRDLPHFHVTEWGKAVLKDGPETPYDPDGYLARLNRDVPGLDRLSSCT